ncbi:MAG: serine/threonine-protein kinase [Polyangiales bacterium]
MRVLGRGGMGIVYEAEHLVTGRHVAIKVMHPESEIGPENVKRFMNEADAAGQVKHPNVVAVLDAGEDPDDGSLFIVLELLTGIDLATYLMRYEKLLPTEAITVVSQVLQALIAAHREGIVHRDLKPENIFLARQSTGETHVKIVDFGISKAINPEKAIPLSITQSNTTVGTPHYMSPEQARGDAIDPRSDIWALGVVMYECLTGVLPFDGDNYNSQILAVVTESHDPASSLGIDQGLSDIIDRCLMKDREARFESAAAMLDALREYAETHRHLGVRASLLKAPSGPKRARPDPTMEIDSVEDVSDAELSAILSKDTLSELPVFPGMVSLEEEARREALTPLARPVVAGGAAPLPLSQRPGAWHSDAPPPMPLGEEAPMPEIPRAPRLPSLDATEPPPPGLSVPPPAPPRRRWIVAAFVAGVSLSLVVSAAAVRLSRPPPAATAAAPTQVQIRFANLPEGSQLVIQGVRYWSDTAYVPRGAAPLRVRIESAGNEPLEFSLVPDRDQTVPVALRPSAPAASPTPPPTSPAPPSPSTAPAASPPPPAPGSPPPVAAAPAPRALPPLPTSVGPAPGVTGAETGTLSIGGVPRWEVRIDEVPVGGTPIYNRSLPVGEHRVVCTRAGLHGAAMRTHTVTVRAGRRAQVFCDTH